MPSKSRAPYRPFEYPEAGADYQEFELAEESDRVPSSPCVLNGEQTKRLDGSPRPRRWSRRTTTASLSLMTSG
jgi:hypothetical protein